jgi:hypothetical protein
MLEAGVFFLLSGVGQFKNRDIRDDDLRDVLGTNSVNDDLKAL